jgi:hypothetical protein
MLNVKFYLVSLLCFFSRYPHRFFVYIYLAALYSMEVSQSYRMCPRGLRLHCVYAQTNAPLFTLAFTSSSHLVLVDYLRSILSFLVSSDFTLSTLPRQP